jgi:hypothetical protein
MNDPTFFGYGSLVNLKTHAYVQPERRQVSGWRRIWRSTSHSDVAILSVTPDAGTTLDGIMARVPGADWAALDEREYAYRRQSLKDQTAIYEIVDEIIHPESGPHPILRSYLDVVIQGYLQEFGPEGAARFFETTDNWGPIQDDRDAPLYPRHQSISAEETDFIDSHLAKLGRR